MRRETLRSRSASVSCRSRSQAGQGQPLADGLLPAQAEHGLRHRVQSEDPPVHVHTQNARFQGTHQNIQIGLRFQIGTPQGGKTLPRIGQGIGIGPKLRAFGKPGKSQRQGNFQQRVGGEYPGAQIQDPAHGGRHILRLSRCDGKLHIRGIAGAGIYGSELDLGDAQPV